MQREEETILNSGKPDVETRKYDSSEFRVEIAKEEYIDDYLEFIKQYFWPREQLSLGCHVDIEESAKTHAEFIKLSSNCQTSLCTIHVPSNRLVGVQINLILERNGESIGKKLDFEHSSENLKNFRRIINSAKQAVNFFEDPMVDKYMEIAATAIHPQFTGNRLAFRMGEESQKMAITRGCKLIVSYSTNKITQHIRRKMGLETVHVIDYATCEVDGKRVIDMNSLNGTLGLHVMRKYLVPENKLSTMQ